MIRGTKRSFRAATILLAVGLIVVGCGGGNGEGNDDDGENQPEATSSDDGLADPCQLIDQATLDSYFTESVDPEPGGSGRFLTCTWSDSNANSILVSVSVSDSVNRPDTCPDCIDLDFADDGYATSVDLQSTAEFVVGNDWYAVTTTGLDDDSQSIAALARSVFERASD
jgi:hypothetical protein